MHPLPPDCRVGSPFFKGLDPILATFRLVFGNKAQKRPKTGFWPTVQAQLPS